MNIARCDAPQLPQRVANEGHRVALVEPKGTVGRQRGQKDDSRHDDGNVGHLKRLTPRQVLALGCRSGPHGLVSLDGVQEVTGTLCRGMIEELVRRGLL